MNYTNVYFCSLFEADIQSFIGFLLDRFLL